MIKLFNGPVAVKAFLITRLIPKLRGRFNLIFVICLGFISGLILFGDRNSVYNIKGNTQTITLKTSNNPLNKWQFFGGEIFAPEADSCFEGFTSEKLIKIAKNIHLSISNHTVNGNHAFLITAKSEEKTVAKVEIEDSSCDLGSYVEIIVPYKSELTLPFEAQTFIGEDVGVGVEKLLIDGSIVILEKQFFTARRFIGEEVALNMGDRVRFDNERENLSKGFLRLTDADTFYFSASSQAKHAYIERFGSSTLTISPSIWSRLTKDPIVAALGSLFALLFLLIEFFMAFNQIIKPKKINQKHN